MKKLINRPEEVVRQALEGAVALSPGTALLSDENIVIQSGLPDAAARPVAVISGGGSGHEPAHAGYVGRSMLTAAVAGDVFTSPSSDAVLSAIRAVSGPAGAVLIVKNYTGDRLNFGLAAEIARAEGIPVEIVVVADDAALRDTVAPDRRRGLAGTVLVHKITGAAAAQGHCLAAVAAIARDAAQRVSSMGISLGTCILPSVGKPGFVLGEKEVEVGLGIHGEPGVFRMEIASADELVELTLKTILVDGKVRRGDEAVLLVNGLGSTPPLELAILARSALRSLAKGGVTVVRAWAGTFLSALDMQGFSLSVMPVTSRDLPFFDMPVEAQAWPGGGLVNAEPLVAVPSPHDLPIVAQEDQANVSPAGRRLQEIFASAARALIAAEDHLATLDGISGDGDLGASMRRGAEAILDLPEGAFSSVSKGLSTAADRVRRAIAGSSGPFYAAGLMRASRHLATIDEPSASDVAAAFAAAVQAISELGGARPGDRTMVDALQPAASTFEEQIAAGLPLKEAWERAVTAAEGGMRRTIDMRPKLGRASYIGGRVVGSPDAGAAAVTIWLAASGAVEDASHAKT
ncbi:MULTISPECIES: dihydroxyacetone kinase family protein [unclassified Rhizobium]|uniref:dihydroxyacetone kinase family protein n=1 Tax=unclassified Rhizobium TaxID=2613769 RepID=UPI0021686E48|nr:MULTISPECIES: dihydroxyacetone kinase family protein [unclassified Rhizobium]MCS3743599.1 dihydroxyacetone kinase [Rhizobium sp. BK661]MCS4096193.1 dihydroxyacetone kinase [Rhizobium sp. BK176]